MSQSNQPAGNGLPVIVNSTGLLSFILGATETTRCPEVAPDGIAMVIELSLHELTVASTPFKVTWLSPCVVPKPEPEMMTGLPMGPVVAERLVTMGPGFTETLSKPQVATFAPLLPPSHTSPM